MWHQLIYLAAITLSPGDTGLPGSTPDIGAAIVNVIKLLFTIIGGLSIIFIIIGGIQIATAAGSPSRFKQGRETVLYAVVGLIVALSSYAIVAYVGGAL
jgi:hypothetical protein